MGVVATNRQPTSSCGPKPEALARIDISKLSQSELHALSLSSDSAFDLHRTDDLVVPQIDRSLFNESAGSRRQTYSRLRLRHHHHHRTRLPGVPPSEPKPQPAPTSDYESHAILHFLKFYLDQNSSSLNSPYLPPPPPPRPTSPSPHPVISDDPRGNMAVVHSGDKKRKRGRKPKGNKRLQENGVGIELEIVNRRGEAVDFTVLESAGDELYSEELRKRTVGLETEEEALGFLRGLEGQWCSRRKRRKYVDASGFGEALPIGWKLLLGLRRREGRVSVYCRRYVSPTGQQFLSCKEASSFLQSYPVSANVNQPKDVKVSGIQLADINTSGTDGGLLHKVEGVNHDTASHSAIAGRSSAGYDSTFSLMEIENLPEVQVQDLFECYKCNLAFDEKNAYLQHLLSIHQRTTRSYRFGNSVGQGVIIRDGKFECQFCHKVFQERRSYNGHVGIHVRNYVQGSEELSELVATRKSFESPSMDEFPSRTSKMDALIEIAQNSILETSGLQIAGEATTELFPCMMNPEETSDVNAENQRNSSCDPSERQSKVHKVDRTPEQDLNGHGGKSMVTGEELFKYDGENIEHAKLDGKEPCGNMGLRIHSENPSAVPNTDVVVDTTGLTHEENVLQNHDPNSSIRKSLDRFPAFTAELNRGETKFSTVGQRLENATAFDDLRLEEIETLKFNFVHQQESPSLPGGSMVLTSDSEMQETFDSSVRFDTEAILLNMAGIQQVTTVCVWCRAEFKVDAFDSEAQSDSIGYMCPACKAKISGHLDSGLSMRSHGF